MLRVFLCALPLLIVGCDSAPTAAGPSVQVGEMTVTNASGVPIAVLAVGEEIATRIDLIPRWSEAVTSRNRVDVGASRSVEVESFVQGEGLVLFVYRVASDGTSSYETGLAVAAEDARDPIIVSSL